MQVSSKKSTTFKLNHSALRLVDLRGQQYCRKNRGSIQRALDNVKLTMCVCCGEHGVILPAIRSNVVLDKQRCLCDVTEKLFLSK